ncbi:hypothetical protein O7599_05510 [Streptomyces sp. WMMC500]|uniref:hypothetical protein n=1 Tax=Streptomyces sp. WMMC500 TaxID=3015154 RepID=UPI00248CDC7A|nr:hypothetical protein [Streptomyces sp. WMMC500]WBB61998.1 hypothetical protein O7599_05510 [Streptomyces sp. WMMC500]
MKVHRYLAALCVAGTLLPLTGCGGTSGAPDLPQGDESFTADPGEFTVDIDNKYWPMKPGRRWIYREVDEEGNVLKVVVTVANQKKKIANGITARVLRDTVTKNGELIEDTIDWYAQDSQGNIWYLGEKTAEFSKGKVSSTAGSWEAGIDGALPGVVVAGSPSDGQRYRQEFFKGEAEDNGEVLSTGEQVEVPAGHYRNALLTKDTNTLEPRVLELKLYAPGVGPVLTLDISGGSGSEELVTVDNVDPATAEEAGTTPLGTPYGNQGRASRYGPEHRAQRF